MMKKYPCKLSYTAKTALWAGTRLKEEFGKQSEFDTISETWELSVRDDEMALITNGEAAGKTLREYFELCSYDCVSPSFTGKDRFPLLVKLIDANDILSVQVHPDDAYAAAVENDSGKTEMWYIVDAKEGAQLVYGLKPGVSREDFARATKEGRLKEVMNYCPVKKGQTYFIPAGMLHAIGAGILIAEIQQNSDHTYRVYDFDRVGADGKLRPLHVEKALAVTRPFTDGEIEKIRFSCGKPQGNGELLACSDFFKARCIKIDGCIKETADKDSFVSIICLDGDGYIRHLGNEYPISKGDSYFIPADMGEYEIAGKLEVICSRI